MVFVRSPENKTLALNVNPTTTTLSSLIHQIELRLNLPAALQRLYLSPRLISTPQNNDVHLSLLGICPNSTLTLHVPLLGGMQAPVAPKNRLDFLHTKPPPNYVAGLGRGATGFTTRSDIGPARAAPDLPDRSIGAVGPPAAGAGRGRGKGDDDEDDENEEKGYDENQKFDEFEGNDMGLFASSEYDDEDKEADAIWEAVDRNMDSRRKDRREARLKEEIEKYRASNPKITEQFADLKRKLSTLSSQDWESIPDIGDYSRNKKKRFESFVPVPDTLLEKARQEKEHMTAVDPKSRAVGGTETPASHTDLNAMGEGRGTVLSLKLDRLSDSVSGQTVVDPKGYLTDLGSMKITSDAEISDIKKARMLLSSVIHSNPKHPPGWIAAARLEEVAGKLQAARQLIEKGCEECPTSEDVWLEASRLVNPSEAKVFIARGIKKNPKSVTLWLKAAKLEHDDATKRRELMEGLESISDSVRLWKAVVELSNEEDARLLLQRAVECCPLHVELWIAYARLETYENAKKVLNRAREKLPKEQAIWITAAKLEEANGNTSWVGKIIERGIRTLQREGVEIDREAWMKEAEAAERAGSVLTCQAIIRNTIGVGVEEEDRKRTWVADAEECKKRGSIETARAIYAHALTIFLTKKSIWLKAAQLEKSHGTRESLDSLLRKAVTYIPHAQTLWLMGAKEKWLAGDVPAARAILQEAYAAIPNSEEIWLAAFKLEFENHEPERARMLLAKARERGGTERVWMKSAIVERELGKTEEERKLLDEGLKRFPSFFKLWLMLGQLEERLGNLEKAKQTYELGLKHCPNCIPMWISLANLEERMNGLSKARAVLTMARKKNPQNPEIWLAAVRAESRHGNTKEADSLMAKALQECPNSGILWATSVEMVPRPKRKSRTSDAYKKCDQDPYVVAVFAKLLWHDRKVEKARHYLNRAVTLAPDIGDFWALYYKFELQHGDEEIRKDVVKRCVAAEPKHGEKWQAISKAVENSHLSTEAILKKVGKCTHRQKDENEKGVVEIHTHILTRPAARKMKKTGGGGSGATDKKKGNRHASSSDTPPRKQAAKKDPFQLFAEKVRDHKDLESRWAVLQETRVEYFRGKDFVSFLRNHPELKDILDLDRNLEVEDIANTLLRKNLLVRCDRVVKIVRPGKKKLSTWPAHLEIYPDQIFSDNDAFFAWAFVKRHPLWQTLLSFSWPLLTLAICLFPVYPHRCKLLILYTCATLLLIILCVLLVRGLIFGTLWILLGKRVWFFPNILAEEATLKELFQLWPKKDEEEGPKWTARLFYLVASILSIMVLKHHAPDEAARARYQRRVSNIIDDVLEWSPSLALSGMMDKQTGVNETDPSNFTEGGGGSKAGDENEEVNSGDEVEEEEEEVTESSSNEEIDNEHQQHDDGDL